MKSSELRIGNLVDTIEFKNVEVLGISTNNIGITIDSMVFVSVDVSDIKSIPITEKWLIKFGFTKYEWMDGCFIKTSFGDLMIQFFRDEIHLFFTKVSVDSKGMMFDGRRFVGDKKTFTKIQYVHQLQNLYFALTGEELTIK
jgi:hypothetical protein